MTRFPEDGPNPDDPGLRDPDALAADPAAPAFLPGPPCLVERPASARDFAPARGLDPAAAGPVDEDLRHEIHGPLAPVPLDAPEHAAEYAASHGPADGGVPIAHDPDAPRATGAAVPFGHGEEDEDAVHGHGPEGARLADLIAARESGIDPNEAAARKRADSRRKAEADARGRSRWRLKLLSFAFILAYASVAGRMGLIAASEPEEPRFAGASDTVSAMRAEITDRNGELLAVNLPVWSLFAHPQEMVDPDNAAEKLATVFPDLDADELKARFKDGRRFLWIKKSITPAERVRVHDIGDPGLQFGRREMRVYPGGRLAAHVLGGASFGREGVNAAEIVGVGGIEAKLDAELRDPARAGAPLRLSLDLRVQRAMADVLCEGMERYTAKGAAGVLMDARTGEVLSLVSLPDFDPNDRPIPFGDVKAADFPTFNRAAQGLYELGSTFKIFTAALMVEEGLANADTMVDTKGPMHWRRFKISDSHAMPARMTMRDVIVESSNVGTARLALMAGGVRQKDLLGRLGLLDPLPVELSEAGRAAPLYPSNWSEISVITISYGHGLSASPLHLASAYATMVNGGLRVAPTLLAGAQPPSEEARVISEETSLAMRDMLRGVVTDGTGRNADVPGYYLGGKTGTAEKASGGGYAANRVVATFAGAFPMHDPRYVIIVTYDEATAQTKWGPRRPAGWTAAPSVKEAITRIAPILGMRPMLEAEAEAEQAGGGLIASR